MIFFSRSRFVISAILFITASIFCICAAVADKKFTLISKGVEYGAFTPAPNGMAGKMHILRIDPGQARMGLVLASEQKVENKTVSDWCRDYKMVAAINAGMYLKDYKTNVGYLRNGSYVQNKRLNSKYLSALAFNPKPGLKTPGLDPAVLVDLDSRDARRIIDNYECVVQNLRLLKGNGVNVWGKSDKKWSESAIGIDQQGRLLFIFCRNPYPMWQFNEAVKSLNIGVTRMMHLEGGPIASLSVRTKGLNLDLAGSYESNSDSEENAAQWPVPNVIAVFEK